MKTFVKKNLIWVFALVVGIGTMSFKLVEPSDTWYYASEDDDEGDFRTPGKWENGSGPHTCNGLYVKPCRITASSFGELETLLSEKTNEQVLFISDSTRD